MRSRCRTLDANKTDAASLRQLSFLCCDCVMLCIEINVVDGKRLTFEELTSLTTRLACGLMAAGFKPRDRLLLISHNITEYAPLFFAVAGCRGHLTTLSPSATDGVYLTICNICALSQGRSQDFHSEGNTPPLPLLSLSFPSSFSLPFPPFPFPSCPLERQPRAL